MDIATVGVVGLGNMGMGMAATLAGKGFAVLGTDIDGGRRAAAEAAGITFLPALTELLRRADALVFSLPLARDVEAVVTAAGGLLTRRDRKVVVIDTSTSDPGTTRRLAARLAEAGHALLDAPVSGGPSGAAGGTLTMMVGGGAEDVALASPVLAALSSRAIHVGSSGAGNVAKLVNNLLVAAHLVTTGEAMRLSEAAGLSAEDALKVVNTATGRSAVSELMMPRWIVPGTFDSGFSAGLMRKDVRLALELAAESGAVLPLSGHVGAIWGGTRDCIADADDFTRMADYRAAPDTPGATALPGIDHPLILVRDIEAARAFYARLGFTLTPVGRHPWGTSTSLAVLERSALELMGIYDDTLLDGLAVGGFRFGRHMHDALAEREGLALVALHGTAGTDAAADGAAMVARGVASQGSIEFRRKVRPPGRDWDEAVVSLAILLDPALPRASHFIARQHRPELLWVPEWMRHANGATHVAAVTYLADDPAPLLRRLGAMFGPVAACANGWEAQTGQGCFRVLRPDAWSAEFGATPRPMTAAGGTAGVAVDVAVRDLLAAARVLGASGVAVCPTQAGPAVRDVAACGNTVIRFVAA